jgi:hypothetical protein
MGFDAQNKNTVSESNSDSERKGFFGRIKQRSKKVVKGIFGRITGRGKSDSEKETIQMPQSENIE